jgi:hypothetical protein
MAAPTRRAILKESKNASAADGAPRAKPRPQRVKGKAGAAAAPLSAKPMPKSAAERALDRKAAAPGDAGAESSATRVGKLGKRGKRAPSPVKLEARLWGAEDAAVLLAASERELKRKARKRQTRARKKTESADAAERLTRWAERARFLVALDMSTSPGLAMVDRAAPGGPAYVLVGQSQRRKQQTGFDRVAATRHHSALDARADLGAAPARRASALGLIEERAVVRAKLADGSDAQVRVEASPKQRKAFANKTHLYELLTDRLMAHILRLVGARPTAPAATPASRGAPPILSGAATVSSVVCPPGGAPFATSWQSAPQKRDAADPPAAHEAKNAGRDAGAAENGDRDPYERESSDEREASDESESSAGSGSSGESEDEGSGSGDGEQERGGGGGPGKRADVLVVVESYAYNVGAHRSNSITDLAELGGVMRSKLWRAGLRVAELAPTSIKKSFTGSGHADKADMWRRFLALAPEIRLDEWLPGPFTPAKIPSPQQDIVDAFASVHSLHTRTAARFKKLFQR